MTIASMTGFAREAGITGPYRWAWELKTVNARGLDVRLRTPPGYDALGEEARQTIGKAIGRGTCHAGLTITRSEAEPTVRVNENVLGALVAAVGRMTLPAAVGPASLDGLLAVRGVVEVVENADDEALAEALLADLRAALARALDALLAARRGEGAALSTILLNHLDGIAHLTEAAELCPARRPEAIRARLAEQVASLVEANGGLDPQRLHQEAVLLAAKADIREELDRLRAHVAAARALLAEGGVIGRRLDFLAQEFSREANTLCAKANDVSLTTIGLDLKTVVEQFREQVQNVE
ncbi:YicC/YloC family endoribonuclease [Chelatococcus sp. SYSU_G07232]|uniref:YicC/YloC family endoribonuclease n=1 Tax=Chelatococcus albus TaxID=3047466 RepID=A0ABT7AJY6_9HYPH|nr:YicC/YloC family endoribonuclease [Chelatococcus sp. SYSU_G07232]MDJ1159677.1 YicC/YloC family endoribonuclease [Chelatococcus sp. SYSU_G07232]